MTREIDETTVMEKAASIFEYALTEASTDPQTQIEFYGFQCEAGWYQLLETVLPLIEKQKLPLQIVQIKEKYGRLRIYYRVTQNDQLTQEQKNRLHIVNGMILLAEELSSSICEICGSAFTAERRFIEKRRIKTLCDACAEEYSKT